MVEPEGCWRINVMILGQGKVEQLEKEKSKISAKVGPIVQNPPYLLRRDADDAVESGPRVLTAPAGDGGVWDLNLMTELTIYLSGTTVTGKHPRRGPTAGEGMPDE